MEAKASVFVSTYNRYNSGDLTGVWLYVFDYNSQDEFLAACEALYSDETYPKLMFLDYEGFPSTFYLESEIDERLWTLYAQLGGDLDRLELFAKWCDQTGHSLDSDFDRFEYSYCGEYESDEDFAEQIYSECYSIPEHIYNYIDLSRVARDLMFDYIKIDGHYFTNN